MIRKKLSLCASLFALCVPYGFAQDVRETEGVIEGPEETPQPKKITRVELFKASNATKDEASTLTFVWENDSFANTDRSYTNGMRLAWLSGTQSQNDIVKYIAHNVFGADDDAVLRRGVAIGQSIFTPTDIEATVNIPDQHPYAGWLYGEYSAVMAQRNIIDQMSLQVGMVGPSAGGEFAQNEFHSLIGIEGAKGWENQLEDELGIVLSYERKARRLARIGSTDFGADLTPNYGISLGNVYTQARAGLTLRIGQDLSNDYGPPRVRPSLGGAGYFVPDDAFSWYFFGGVEGRAVAHNIFMDGSLINEDVVDLSRRDFVTDYQGGLVVQVFGVQAALTLVERSKEYDEQEEPQRFGAFSLSRKF